MDFPSQPAEPEPLLVPPFDPRMPRQVPVWVLGPPGPRSAWQRWGRNLVLFLLTVVSVFLTGGLQTVTLRGGRELLVLNYAYGAALTTALLAILVAHEMGHYLACRYYSVDATLPFFLPLPLISPAGTLGAFIRIRDPFPNRRALFDIGVAGPLAGFAVCLPVLFLGLLEAHVVPYQPGPVGSHLGEPLVFQWLARIVKGPLPETAELAIGPLGYAAWFGLLVTALNLMPIGQLDGGHLTYALLGRKAEAISRVGSWLCFALVYFGPSWILWAVLLRVLGRRHPPTLDDAAPVGRARAWIGLLSLAIFIGCFMPDPVIWSWRSFFEMVGLDHLLRGL